MQIHFWVFETESEYASIGVCKHASMQARSSLERGEGEMGTEKN